MTELKLPELAEGVDKATVSYWHFNERDDVTKGQDLVEMVTDKATFNVPAPVSGKIVKINFREGEIVSVGAVLAVIE